MCNVNVVWIWMIIAISNGYHSDEVDVHCGHSDAHKAVSWLLNDNDNTEAADVMTSGKEFH